jgi:hypothetical protein
VWHRVAVSRPSDGDLSKDCTLIVDGDVTNFEEIRFTYEIALHLTERQLCLLKAISYVIRSDRQSSVRDRDDPQTSYCEPILSGRVIRVRGQ